MGEFDIWVVLVAKTSPNKLEALLEVLSQQGKDSAAAERQESSAPYAHPNKYALRGLPFTYIEPTQPVAEEDWEATAQRFRATDACG